MHHRHPLLDAGFLLMLGATFGDFLPPLAAGFACIWYAIQILDWWRGGRK